MTCEIAEQLRDAAIKCSQLAKACSDQAIVVEIEGISADLAEKARQLDRLSDGLNEPA